MRGASCAMTFAISAPIGSLTRVYSMKAFRSVERRCLHVGKAASASRIKQTPTSRRARRSSKSRPHQRAQNKRNFAGEHADKDGAARQQIRDKPDDHRSETHR